MNDTPQWERLPTYKDYHPDEGEFGPVDLSGVEPDVLVKTKQQLFVLAFQDEHLRITKILSGPNYDTLWTQGISEAKANGGFWSIFDNSGRFVDGNVVSR